jgi:hypothetical protein
MSLITRRVAQSISHFHQEEIKYTFKPNFSIVAEFPKVFSIAEIEKEVRVCSATPEFVKKKCGLIANMILSQVPDWYYEEADKLKLYPRCDVRIHRLYPTDYPARPEWHCDGEFREIRSSQPDKIHKHLTATVSSHEGGVSSTEFLNQYFEFRPNEMIPDHDLWHRVNKALEGVKDKEVHIAEDGQLISFDSWTLHRAAPAKTKGWRLFFRLSMRPEPTLEDGGMISKHDRVYKHD